MNETKKERSKEDICRSFITTTKKIINLANKKLPVNNADLDSIRNLVKLSSDMDEEDLIRRCYKKIWNGRKSILDRDEKYLNRKDLEKKYIKEDENKEMIEGFLKTVRYIIKISSDAEKKIVWSMIDILLVDTIDYMKVKKYFTDD